MTIAHALARLDANLTLLAGEEYDALRVARAETCCLYALIANGMPADQAVGFNNGRKLTDDMVIAELAITMIPTAPTAAYELLLCDA